MSSTLSDPGAPGEKPRPRPPLWSGGRQRPRLDLRLFARARLKETRRWGAPVVRGLAGRLDRLAQRVAAGAGRPLALKLGRVGRMLPGAARTGAFVGGTARLLDLASDRLAGPAPVEPLPLRPWEGAPGATRATLAPAPAAAAPEPAAGPAPVRLSTAGLPEGDRQTLEMIRSMIREPVQPSHPVRPPPPPPPRPRGMEALPDLQPQPPAPPGAAMSLAARVLGMALLGLLTPVGAARTGWQVARGADLRLRE